MMTATALIPAVFYLQHGSRLLIDEGATLDTDPVFHTPIFIIRLPTTPSQFFDIIQTKAAGAHISKAVQIFIRMVRTAVSTDIDQILQIDLAAKLDPSRQAVLRCAIDRGECLVSVINGLLVGYAAMDHSFFDRGFVSLVYVDPAHRRRKVAGRLFDELESRCTSARIFTSANLSNLPTQQFLVSRGYVLSGIVQDLDEGDPELFYSKKLR